MTERRVLEDLGEIELNEPTAKYANAMIERAEEDIAERSGDVRVNFRWNRAQVEVVKRAAAVLGVPYQTYLKQVAMRQALDDLRAAAAAGMR